MSKSNPFAAPKRRYSKVVTPEDTTSADEVVTAPSADETVEDTPSAEEAKTEEVPAGSINEVKDWVGDDLERAQAALDAERAAEDGGRSTFIKYLEDMISSD